MGQDVDYWKKNYSFLWDRSSEREESIRKIIEGKTGCVLEPFGLGAQSSDFLSGNAKSHNTEKGAPDFHVKGTNIYIEVTGSYSKFTKVGDNIWIRPDKLSYASGHAAKQDEFFVVVFTEAKAVYVIHFDQETIDYARQAYRNKSDYQIEKHQIRGALECYCAIHSNTKYVKDLNYLIQYLQEACKSNKHQE